MTSLRLVAEDLWLCCGDFNNVISNEEKIERNPRSFPKLSLCRTSIEDNNLLDVGFKEYSFIWSNGREGNTIIQCRLDRSLGSEDL